MAQISRSNAAILKKISPNSEDGVTYEVSHENSFLTEYRRSIPIHICNPYDEKKAQSFMKIRFFTLDDGGILDIHSFLISLKRNYSNCYLIDYTRKWMIDAGTDHHNIKIGTTTNTEATNVSEYISTDQAVDFLNLILSSLNKSLTRSI